ncbi:hypothetical protein NC652_026576 [Populus alba x Populus x berolinensis]|nr:hypothetical protein NC652_026576 [Populus alba x Populus x berolinensis]
MDTENPPQVLPGGCVYSTKALEEMPKRNNGKITCQGQHSNHNNENKESDSANYRAMHFSELREVGNSNASKSTSMQLDIIVPCSLLSIRRIK